MTNKNKQITVAVIGAGSRGNHFGNILARELGHLAKVIAVAEPRTEAQADFAAAYGLKKASVFKSWQEFIKGPKKCDAVVISTMDQDHLGPAVACLKKGYHIMLEKPMANTRKDCQTIEAAQKKSGKVLIVCHSLRYAKPFATLKEIIDSGRIGKVVTLDHLEGVAYWHQSHSFVRANWRNEKTSSFMLLSKSCHDLDYIYHLTGKKFLRVSSHGSLTHFKPENAPKGSTAHCTDGCSVEASCPYSALKLYRHGSLAGWLLPSDTDYDTFLQTLKASPLNRCVYRCDNNVVDHQVVLIEMEDGVTASFTMTAFTQNCSRQTRIHGTGGEIYFDEKSITIRTFGDDNTERIEITPETGGHGGGDRRVLHSWLQACQKNDPTAVLTTAQESLLTHTYTFAAEQARREKRVVEI